MKSKLSLVACAIAWMAFWTGSANADDATITLDLTYTSGAGSAGTWDLYGRVDSTAGTADGQYGLSSVRALLDSIDFGTDGDAVTLAGGIGAIDPIAAGTPFERKAVLDLPNGVIDVVYGQDLSETNGNVVVFNVGNSGDTLLASGTFSAGMDPTFGEDTTGGESLFTTALFLPAGATPFVSGAVDADNTITLITSNLPAGVEGDYNGNGVVDAADYTLWLSLLGSSSSVADGDGSGTVDDGDYTYWKTRFGNTSATGTGGGSVPEPSTLVLMLSMCGLAICRRQRK